MNGIAQYVPYFECQYPQVISGPSELQFQGQGVGDYIENFRWPIPQYLTPGNMRGLGCPDCGGTCAGSGLGNCPDGLFSCGISGWGFGEWGIAAAGVYLITAALPTVKKHGKKAKGAAGKGVSMLGTLTLLAIGGAALYFFAQANTGQS
jgi:hypothetical protein